MSRKGESQHRVDGEDCQLQHLRTSSVRTSGVVNPILLIKWACPPQFFVDPNWKMETGSESKEIHFQLQRESRVSEAIYFGKTYVPANPFVASDTLVFSDDDSKVPIIPVDEIDDEPSSREDDDDDGIPLVAQPLLRRDEVTAAAVTLISLIKAEEPGSNIDLDLLVQLLRNPGMLEQLKNEHEDLAKPQVKSSLPLAVPKPTEVRPARTVVGTTPVEVPGPSLEVRPRRTVVGTTPVAVQGPTLQVRPARTVVGITPVAFQGPSFRPPRTVVGTTPVAVQGPSLEFRPPRTIVGTSPVVVQGPTLDVRPARSVVRTTPVAIPRPDIKSLAKVPVGSQTPWVPSVPFTHSMSQGVKNTILGIHNHLDTQNPSSSKIDLGKIRNLINQYGVPLQADGYTCSPSAPKTGPLVIKDSDYNRSILSQYGTAQENPNSQGPVKTNSQGPVKTVRSNEQRVCTYFNSSKGCMRGSSCWFKHVKVSTEGDIQASEEQQVAKRMKFSGGNFARHT